jgi:2-isopropylmalate synthase
MTRRASTTPQRDRNLRELIRAKTETVTIFGKSWQFQVEEVLGTTLDENLKMISDSTMFLRSRNRNVIYDAEHFFDGFRTNPDYAFSTLRAARESGASMLVLCDTRGGAYPTEIYDATRLVLKEVGGPIGIHCHNDRGMATANSLFAVMAGASHVQGTINGLGERVGNADLVEVVANLRLMGATTNLKATRLASLSRFTYEMSGLREDRFKPFVGEHAFAHKGGVHGDAVRKTQLSYEFFDPSEFGNKRHITVSSQAGRSSLLAATERFGFTISRDDKRLLTLLREVKHLESQGCNLENADATLELIVRRTFAGDAPAFSLVDWNVTAMKDSGEISARCELTMRLNGKRIRSADVGNGPVHALDRALRRVLRKKFGSRFSAKLTGYRVREVDSERATAATVAVYIDFSDKPRTWTTVASSTNIIQASVGALVDGYTYGLRMRGETGLPRMYRKSTDMRGDPAGVNDMSDS